MSTQLNIINDMLAATGTLPVTVANKRHPMYIKTSTKLELIKADVLKMALWFNTAHRTLQPNSDGEVYVPSGLVSFDVIADSTAYTRRGNRVYNLDAGNFDIGKALYCKLVEDVDYDDLPRSVYDYLRAKAVYEFYVNEEGTEPRLSQYKDQRNEAWTLMWREHISGTDVNYFSNASHTPIRLKQNSRATLASGTVYSPE